ncbi:MAG TPA: YebC/PmpR family DNA-binding transcriptional regulator [Bacteroidales bacterium]|nr:YebC/PmpR family DNA-binding transcriptional regulator [Bacteroidales bacterium]HCI56183.1 YebC/PmpR family DNA-binding transcriptional regulator [Bacteroidales bacterium]HOU96925.1 YebC/PmpR family DNA-binding transcriptional regulator [Bacteroidales bacterium]HQG36776.1 YebC/PmpR family DNA-binding transcriptional regulator [Bacteroidales bacterium]HQG53784.1 YebC/PmpR family DNA-binding transcriptional regulator [Bacteroidales bacterium]
MSGHSKWSTIKRKKGAADAKRGKIFTKIIKEITIAAREGGPDPELNPRLRLAIQNAKGANMPKDNIERAIKKAAGSEAANYVETTFEGYGPCGVAVFVECLTDNNNRTVSSIRATFNRHGGSLGTNGSLSFLFERKGVFTIKPEGINLDDLELELIDAGAEEIESDGERITVICAREDFGSINKKLHELGIEPEEAMLKRIPNETKKLDVESARKVLRFIEALEDDDDVQNVYHNLEMTDELAEVLMQ